tara:strand:- start:895 stop:1290 length:396 start_codon:yes stop_codon:yes gene_type:complete
MSTTWTSLISGDYSAVDNSDIDTVSEGSSGGAPAEGNYFTGIMETGQTFYFGSNNDFGITYNNESSSLEFDTFNSAGLADSTVLFNFGDGALKLYKGGPMSIKNLNSTPEASDYEDGAIILVNGELKVKGS